VGAQDATPLLLAGTDVAGAGEALAVTDPSNGERIGTASTASPTTWPNFARTAPRGSAFSLITWSPARRSRA